MIKFLDKHLNGGFLFLFLIGLYSLVHFNIINIHFGYLVIFLFLFFTGLLIEKYSRSLKYRNKLGLASFANSTLNPTPGQSLLDAIIKQGYSVKDIKNMYVMAYTLNHDYLTNSSFAKKMKEVDFNFYLYSKIVSSEDKLKIEDFYKHAIVEASDIELIEHYNVIEMNNNKTFVWYEPSHIVIDGKDILEEGGYLFLSESFTYAKDQFNYILKNQTSYKKSA